MPRWTRLCIGLGVLTAGCSAGTRGSATVYETRDRCEERKRSFVAFVQGLPERAVVASLHVDVPRSTLGSVPGNGPVLQVSDQDMYLDGQRVQERELPARLRQLQAWTSNLAPTTPGGRGLTLYVAASADTDVRTLRDYLAHVPATLQLKLLVRTQSPVHRPTSETQQPDANAFAARLLAAQGATERAAVAGEAYAAFATCPALRGAVSQVGNLEAQRRWPALQKAVLDALPHCTCGELDTVSLQQIIVAEQRAGAAGLGALPLDFLRDERCGASMPLRALGKLVTQIEGFDAEFAGAWQQEALQFEEVLANERLLGYFCNALAGETLAAQQRAGATLYWRIPGSEACQAWRFEPLAKGAPMGTWRRLPAEGRPALAFHYWQAAEEIRLFGPVPEQEATKPTDSRDWECQQNYRMTGVDAESIQTENGKWFLSQPACQKAAPTETSQDCVASQAGM